jgi:hypothetical protein
MITRAVLNSKRVIMNDHTQETSPTALKARRTEPSGSKTTLTTAWHAVDKSRLDRAFQPCQKHPGALWSLSHHPEDVEVFHVVKRIAAAKNCDLTKSEHCQ